MTDVSPILAHLGPLHPFETWLVLLIAFGPFVVAAFVVRILNRRRR